MYYQQGGEQDQIMQLIQMFAQMNQMDPQELIQQLKQMAPEEQQQAIQQMAQTLQQPSASQQQEPYTEEVAMMYGGMHDNMYVSGGMIRRADGSYSKRGLWDNIRANKGSGKKPSKEMLDQEKKIRAQEAAYGGMFRNGGTNNAGFDALPDYVQANILRNMGYGGYYDPMELMAEGGEPNGGMALGQMSAVSDKMNKLRQFVSPEQNLDPWIASKLAVMDHSADAISDYMMYNTEDSDEGEEIEEEEGLMPEMGEGGYTVTRSNDRKGKTHKVTGPDGTVKYFGDSKLGQHPKDPERKKAFYARHKKNLENNPFFRAFARKTWKEGGSTFSGNAWYQGGGSFIPEYDMSFPANYSVEIMEQGGGIKLDPAKKGTFKAQAKKMGMSVQEAASSILNAPEGRYTPAMRKKANFAKNFAKQMGGPVEGEVLDVSPEQLEVLRQQGYQFEIM